MSSIITLEFCLLPGLSPWEYAEWKAKETILIYEFKNCFCMCLGVGAGVGT